VKAVHLQINEAWSKAQIRVSQIGRDRNIGRLDRCDTSIRDEQIKQPIASSKFTSDPHYSISIAA